MDKTEFINKVAKELSEYYGIPCDLCNKYFDTQHNCFIPKVETCGNEIHWKMLLERILKND